MQYIGSSLYFGYSCCRLLSVGLHIPWEVLVMKTACDKDHNCKAYHRDDCDYMARNSWVMCESETVHSRCSNMYAWPENNKEDS